MRLSPQTLNVCGGDATISGMARNIQFADGEYYHVYDRGVDKRLIYLNDIDKKRFQKILYLCNGTRPFVVRDIALDNLLHIDRGHQLVSIGAYGLMDNHFHILIKQVVENGVTEFMRKLKTAYTKYFNEKYDRTGSLFGGRFKAKHVDSDGYLRHIFAYIHLNPLELKYPGWEEGFVAPTVLEYYLKRYYFSSYVDHLGLVREENSILNIEQFPHYFNKGFTVKDQLHDYFSFTPDVERLW